jgi:urease subunit gamma/beta
VAIGFAGLVDGPLDAPGALHLALARAGALGYLDTARPDTAHLDTAPAGTAHPDTAHPDTAHPDTAHPGTRVDR